VSLIDASLDHQDSLLYKQEIHKNGTKRIHLGMNMNKDYLQISHIEHNEKISKEKNRYNFPTIDFKFQNTGNATAFLWQFTIRVLEAKIDPTPVLDFKIDVVDNALKVLASNKGWGTAYDLQIKIDESVINSIFPDSVRQNNNEIDENTYEKEVLRLIPEEMIQTHLKEMSKNFVELDSNKTIRFHFLKPRQGIKIDTVKIIWSCKDKNNIIHNGQEEIECYGNIALTSDGFIALVKRREFKSEMLSDITYITIIDPVNCSQEIHYPISRKIPSGDIERFHIMIGATKSCHLRLQFLFYVDREKFIESENFEINVWNPKNTRWHRRYQNGSELYRQLELLENRNEISKGDKESLEIKTSNFPFSPTYEGKSRRSNIAWENVEIPNLLKMLTYIKDKFMV